MPQITHPLLPKQMDFVMSTAPEVLYSGAFGAGKTRAVCIKVLTHAVPKNRVGLCRKTLTSLKATTLKTLLDGDGNLPPVLPYGSYKHNKADKTIHVIGGGEIVYFGMDQHEKIGSLNLGSCGIDEGVELEEADWIQLRGRCRNEVDPHRQLFGACNPGAPAHFLAKRFGITGDQPSWGCELITTCSADNWFLPPDYQEWLDNLTGTFRLRYRDGIWAAAEGVVYDMLDEQRHVVEKLPQMTGYWVGVDYGTGSVTTFWLLGLGVDKCLYFVDFWRWDVAEKHRQMADPEFAEELDKWLDGLNIRPNAVVIPADAQSFAVYLMQWKAKSKRIGPLAWADRSPGSVLRRIRDVGTLFAMDRLKFSALIKRKGGLKEWQSYAWDKKAALKGDDVPLKQGDHDPDAGGYVVEYVKPTWQRWLRAA